MPKHTGPSTRPPKRKAGKQPSARFMDRDASVPFLMVAVSNKLVASASQVYMRYYGLGIMEWRVMALLAADPGITGKDISVLSGVTAGSVSRAINSLKRLRYLDISNDVEDNRRSFLRLNAAGMALHSRVIISALQREGLLLAGFSRTEHRSLLGYLKRLLVNIVLVNAHRPTEG
jgi:DNA-binding MarR family transcriptional regulator